MNILFMCVANSARSQIAEGLAKQIFGEKASVESAGSLPKKVNPLAIEVMKEAGVDLQEHFSKSIEELKPEFVDNLKYILTLCAEEVCPVISSITAKKLHWPLPDPAGHSNLSHQEQLQLFRDTRDALRIKLLDFKAEVKL